MTNLTHVTGDIFSSEALGMGQGVNIRGVMGSGIAVQFRNRFPDMYQAYRAACLSGQVETGKTLIWPFYDKADGVNRFIYNITSQDDPGPNAQLEWLEMGTKASLEHARDSGIDRIALPRIGSGVGGLDQDDVEALLVRLAGLYTVDIELWTTPANFVPDTRASSWR